ncbi:unnamed protein product, partial [marine sediment metagenome]
MNTYLLTILVLTLIIAFTVTGIYIYKKYGKYWFRKHKKAIASTVAISILASAGVLLVTRDLVVEGDDDVDYVYYTSSGRNAYFTTNTSVHFSQIILDSDYVQFNNTKFEVNAASRINITFMYLNPQLIIGDADANIEIATDCVFIGNIIGGFLDGIDEVD